MKYAFQEIYLYLLFTKKSNNLNLHSTKCSFDFSENSDNLHSNISSFEAIENMSTYSKYHYLLCTWRLTGLLFNLFQTKNIDSDIL